MIITALQRLFINMLSPWMIFVNKIPMKVRYGIITGCFFVDIVLFCIVRYVLRRESYFYNTMLGMALMVVIAIMSLDRELKYIHWRRSVWITWFGMCIAFTISDILVPKKICGMGIVLAFIFTGVFFVWQNHTRRDLLWECFKKAVRIAFMSMAVVCFFFRPLYDGGRYAGIFTNPNTFGLYLIFILAVYLSDLDFAVITGKKLVKTIPTYIGIALVVFYMWLTQARTSMLTGAVLVLMWIVFRLVYSLRTHRWRIFLKNSIAAVALSTVLYPVFLLGVTYLPWAVGNPIIFDGETLYLSDGLKIEDFGETVIAEPDADMESFLENYADKVSGYSLSEGGPDATGSDEADSDAADRNAVRPDVPEKQIVPHNVVERLWYVLENTQGLNALTMGRIDIYKGYYKNLNFKGHTYISQYVNGSFRAHAHNNWLQFGYTYGYFGMIFYALITVMAAVYSIKFYIKRRRETASYAFLISAACIGFVVATIAECLILPFEVFPAFAFWFAFGELFVKKVPKNRLLAAIEGE